MKAAVFYHPEAYSTDGPKLMGRNAAGDSFLRAFFQYSSPGKYAFAQLSDRRHAASFSKRLDSHGRLEKSVFITDNSLKRASLAGVVFHPGPNISDHAIQRRLYGDSKWSLCGITHTTSSASSMDAIANLVTTPVQPWDAIICPSSAVRENFHTIIDFYKEELRSRLGAQRFVLPQTPVIPLGVHTADFYFTTDDKLSAREALNASSDEIIVLYLGRLSFHAKAHPLAMYQAASNAQRISGRKVTIVECGWHANDYIKKAFDDAASMFPNIRVVSLDGRQESNRKTAWAGADIFCSLSDNIQETFGITPVEAMASGIPSIVSDWNGYRDTVRDGIDGIRVPTIAPAPNLLKDLSQRYALGTDTYDMYCGHASSFVAVSPTSLQHAFVDLISSESKRKQMGSEAAKRARDVYDWRHIMARYEGLWSELNQRRKFYESRSDTSSRSTSWPTRLDPSVGFKNYPTRALNLNTMISLVTGKREATDLLKKLRTLRMVSFSESVLPDEQDILSILDRAEKKPATARALISHAPPEKRPYLLRCLSWLVKLGILSFE
jgi:starch synthase